MPGSHKVRFGKAAIDDLKAVYIYLAEVMGHDRADHYVSRMETFCRSLESFPFRGRSRVDLMTGLRSITFESKVVIVYRVSEAEVEVMRLIHGAQDYDGEDFS